MKKTINIILVIAFVASMPLTTQAFSLDKAKSKVAGYYNTFQHLNVTGFIKNSKGAVRVKDKLNVTKRIRAFGNLDLRGTLKNNDEDQPVKVTDDFQVDGSSNLQGGVDTNTIDFTVTDISSLDTSTLNGGNIYYDDATKKTYLWNGSGWIDLTQQNSNTTYTAGDGIDLNSGEFTTDENYSHTWTTDQTFSDDVTVTGQVGINGASVNDSYGLNMGTYDADGERGQNMTVSANTDGDTVYGSYYSVDTGTGVPSSGNRFSRGIQMDVTAGEGYDPGYSAYTIPTGLNMVIDSSQDIATMGWTNGVSISNTDYIGNKQWIYAFYNSLKVGGTNSMAYGNYSSMTFETGTAQDGESFFGQTIDLDAGDSWTGLYLRDVSSTGGTAYGAFIDIDDDTYSTAYSVYVEDGSAPSQLGNLMQVVGTSAPPETCNATWAGSFYYDSDLNLPCVCNGTNWLQMDDFVSVCS